MWNFTWNTDGTLDAIEVEADTEPANGWEESINEIFQRAFVSTIEAKKVKVFRRNQFAYFGPPLDGEYYISGWRLAPANPENSVPFHEQVIYLDRYVEAIDKAHTIPIGMVEARRIATLLSLFLDKGFYSVQPEHRWVILGEGKAEFLQLGYI